MSALLTSDAARTPEMLRALAASGARPRLAMRGTSMEPLLHAGMLLELAPFDSAAARVGDIVVFVEQGRLVVHRIVASPQGDALRTCGDARPWSPEIVPLASVVGSLAAVYASDAAGAARIDDADFCARGLRYVRARPARAFAYRARLLLARIADAIPWRRKSLYGALLEAIGGDIAGDPARTARAIERVDPGHLATFARRHACGIVLQRALGSIATERARELRAVLQPVARSAAVRGFAYRHQVASVVRSLNDAAVPFALLKGAARAYANEPDALLHVSHDLDILVPAHALDAAIAALQAGGYAYRASERERSNFRKRHHHVSALFPPGSGWAVELHVRLARTDRLSTPTDWDALADRFVTIAGEAGSARTLDPFGTTLHHAIHGIGLERLRDVAVCARLLRALDTKQRAALARIARIERRDPIRLRATLALSAKLAGMDGLAPDAATRAYLAWAEKRESMPRDLGKRTQPLEAWYAGGGSPFGLRMRYIAANEGTPLRVLGRLTLVPLALLYARFLRT